ncbi:Tyrosyl-tRNA synthetase, partial [hydrothermal vent metagenome]
MTIDFLEELRWRGLLHQATDEEGIAKHLVDPGAHQRRAYAGFDPTADSLTIGNLVPIMVLVHFARAGHEPIVLMGGGTGLIGDPSGKSDERTLMTTETVEANVTSQQRIFEAVFAGAGLGSPTI